ncbi:protein jagged-1b-like [Parasteatoda tepidariorum]|uniref:protein jagged-1b-like n=1 Tax=Parasteatoda tepidariorum TaxID=114398 RepID=UPI0039BD0548
MAVSMVLKVWLFSVIVSINAFKLEKNGEKYLNGLNEIAEFKEMHAGGGNCEADAECAYGGICKDSGTHRSCACKRGLDGEYCEEVVDCVSGKYKNCKGANGTCGYAIQLEEAICSCEVYQVLDNKTNICKEVRCEKRKCIGGTCRVIGGKEICRCPPKHILHDDRCVECDCGVAKCTLDENGKPKPCSCDAKMKLHDGKCRTCDCGDGECELDADGRPKCICYGKLKEFNGKCIRCDCGDGECELDTDGKPKPCKCFGKLKEFNKKCINCDCGQKAKSIYQMVLIVKTMD